MTAPIFTYTPTSVELKRKPRVLSTDFGDGYMQEMPDGLNANLQVWQLSFKKVAASIGNGIDNFLSEREGCQRFYWVTPKGAQLLFVCKEWNVSNHDEPTFFNATATFEQRPA